MSNQPGGETPFQADKRGVEPSMPKQSASPLRLLILLVLFIVAAGGIYGYQQFLAGQIPQGEAQFKKERAPNVEEEEEPESSMQILSEIFTGSNKPSKEVERLKEMGPEDVVFTYDAIMKMSVEDLKKNIKETSDKLIEKRSSLPPSLGGGSFGPGEGEENGPKGKDTVQGLALPLEVMQQVLDSK
ncbi:MAG: hypothetical protein AAFN77_03780 [Planctomycetota bacterium]